jgi:tetratricopeptide (TPR) repeat protein
LQLSVFRGGFTVDDAEAVLDLEQHPEAPWAMFVVEALLDKSLLRLQESPRVARFGTYLMVRDWAGARLAKDRTAAAAAGRRHADWFARLGDDEFLGSLDTDRTGSEVRLLRTDRANLEAALRFARASLDGLLTVRVACALAAAGELDGPFRPVLDQLLDLPRELSLTPSDELRLRLRIARLFARLSSASDLRDEAERALAIARELEDERGQAEALIHRSMAEILSADAPAARRSLAEAVPLAQSAGARALEGKALGNRAVAEHVAGRVAQSRRDAEAALAIHREVGDLHAEAIAINSLAAAHTLDGDLEKGRVLFEEARVLHMRSGDQRGQALAELNVALISGPEGADPETLRNQLAALGRARRTFARIGSRALEALSGAYEGIAAMRLGTPDTEDAIADGVARVGALGLPHLHAMIQRDWGLALLRSDRPAEALERLGEARTAARDSGDPAMLAAIEGYTGRAHLELGREREAREALTTAEALLREAEASPRSLAALPAKALRAQLDE